MVPVTHPLRVLVCALLFVEWIWMPDRTYHKCPDCDEDEPRDGRPISTHLSPCGHAKHCCLDFALRCVELDTPERRDAARAELADEIRTTSLGKEP